MQIFFAIIYKYINTHNQNIKHKSALKERKIKAYTEVNISSEKKIFFRISQTSADTLNYCETSIRMMASAIIEPRHHITLKLL